MLTAAQTTPCMCAKVCVKNGSSAVRRRRRQRSEDARIAKNGSSRSRLPQRRPPRCSSPCSSAFAWDAAILPLQPRWRRKRHTNPRKPCPRMRRWKRWQRRPCLRREYRRKRSRRKTRSSRLRRPRASAITGFSPARRRRRSRMRKRKVQTRIGNKPSRPTNGSKRRTLSDRTGPAPMR